MNVLDPTFLTKRAILSPLNEDDDKLNTLATEMLSGDPPRTCCAQDTVIEAEGAAGGDIFPAELLNSLHPTGLPPFQLKLKIGQPVILLRNINAKKDLCNASRLIVQAFGDIYIQVEIILGPAAGESIFLPRMPLDTTDEGSSPVLFRKRQFSIKPAFAMAINKSQEQTFEVVGLYLPQSVYAHGQLYVALSRCTNPRNPKVLLKNYILSGHPGYYTHNIVYKNVLT